MKMTKDIEMMIMSVDEMIQNLERNEAKALREEMLQDLEEIIYKVYSTVLSKIFKTLNEETLQKRISDCVNLEMQIERQKSTIEIYQDIKMYRKVCNL